MHCDPAHPTAELCARHLLQRVRTEAERDYVAREALHATAMEIEAVRTYDLAFRLHDRSQRARKLVELDQRLADPELAMAERLRIEEFRTVLRRLAQYETDVESGAEPRIDQSAEQIGHWVEQSKLDAALYRLYGGVIGINAAGPYAHGARAALVLDYLSVHPIEFVDKAVEAAFWRLLDAAPLIVFRGNEPDFTPFWQRAIPASYMPD